MLIGVKKRREGLRCGMYGRMVWNHSGNFPAFNPLGRVKY